MQETGVIFRMDQPTDWCARMMVTPTSTRKVRVCVDLSKLNEYVKRENHPLPAVDTTLGRLAGSIGFIGFRTKFDFARLNENSTALFCTYNFFCGTEYRERKINFKRLHRCRREREELLKSRTRYRINLLIVSTEIVFTNLKMRHGLVNNKNY